MKQRVRLSQCMIVKNEEKNMERALSWGKKIVFEQIVVDTGSTDRTVEIAEKMGAKVYHFEWTDDFSAAKNYAIEQASGNWIAFLDADEYLKEADAKKILEIIDKVEKTLPEDKKPHILRSALIDLDENGKPGMVTVQDRFFRNVKKLRYYNRIHEQIRMPEGEPLLVAGIEEKIAILHTGYTKTVYNETKKLDRNIRLLQKECEENPDSDTAAAYLGESLAAAGRTEEAEKMYRKVVDAGFRTEPPLVSQVIRGLMDIIVNRNEACEDDDLMELYEKGIQKDGSHPDFDYRLSCHFFMRKDWENAVFYMQNALEKQESYTGNCSVYLSGEQEKAYSILTKAYLEMNEVQQAVRYTILTLRVNKKNEALLNVLLDLLRKESYDRNNMEEILVLLSKLYNLSLLRDKLLIMKSAKLVGFTELYRRLQEMLTPEEKQILSD